MNGSAITISFSTSQSICVDAALLLLELLLSSAAARPRAHHQPRWVGDRVDDALPALLRRQPETMASAPASWLISGLRPAVHDVVDVRAARLIPEHLEAGLARSYSPSAQRWLLVLLQPAGHLGELAQPARPDRR